MRREHVNLFRNAIEARKIGFPNVIMPGDVRNDLYLTIEQGVFERGGKVRLLILPWVRLFTVLMVRTGFS